MYNGTKMPVHDKVSSDHGSRTMCCTVAEGPLNCLALNRDCSQVVVAGRNVFKIFTIEEDKFEERINLRVGKNLNLNFSASDVIWNHTDDNILATAATNGAVVVWDLNKTSRSKQEWVSNEHKRTVNKVCFHLHESNILISGSQDGTMKIFDVRKKEVSTTFHGKSESVRDVQFSQHQYFTFASAFENGNIQVWDMRNPSKWERHFTAHSGPAFAIDWHPEERNWIATAGRDKIIKIWDLSNSRINNTHTVQTIAPIARIKWRPQRRFHITSCSLIVDCSINVWDIRRPYIPFAAFSEHKDVVTGIVWKHHDPHTFLSSGKDNSLYQHMFRDATRPADNANPVCLDINVFGELAHGSSEKLTSSISGNKNTNYSSTKFPSFFRRQADRSEQFTMVSSSNLNEYFFKDEEFSMSWFIWCARQYQLTGKPLEDLCEHNANVAANVGRHQIAQSWKILKMLYSKTLSAPAAAKTIVTMAVDMEESAVSRTVSRPTQDIMENDHNDKHFGDVSTERCCEFGAVDQATSQTDLSDDSRAPCPGMSEEESDVQEAEGDQGLQLDNIMNEHLVNTQGDFFFGEVDMEPSELEFDTLNGLQNGQDWNLPSEAFQLRHEIIDSGAAPSQHGPQSHRDSPSSNNETDNNTISNQVLREPNIKESILSILPLTTQMPTWQFTDLVTEMIHFYARNGDPQMAASVLIVLGDKIKPHIDELVQEQYLMGYVELLGRFQLWSIANEAIKLSNHPVVSSCNEQSTTVHTCCGHCSKPLIRSGWLCDRCKTTLINCSICHLPVRGLYVWCQGCSHGGHLNHIQEWLRRNTQCPTGCGHHCEYT